MNHPLFKISNVLAQKNLVLANGQPREITSIGIQTDLGPTFWGGSPYTGHNSAKLIQKVIHSLSPKLRGIPVQRWLETALSLETISETIQLEREIEVQGPPVESNARRQLLRGFQPEETQVLTETYDVEQLLPRSIIWGTQIALMKATLAATRQFLGEWLEEKHPVENESAKLQLGLSPETAASPMMFRHAAEIVVNIPAKNAVKRFGSNAQHLQKYVRQLAKWVKDMDGSDKPLVIILNGVLGDIYGSNPGRMLGAISGLEAAAKPVQLVLVNPFSTDAPQESQKQAKTIRDYMRLRKLNSKIMLSHHPESGSGELIRWDEISGLGTMVNISCQGKAFDFPSGLSIEDRALLFEVVQLRGFHRLWLPQENETAVFAINMLQNA